MSAEQGDVTSGARSRTPLVLALALATAVAVVATAVSLAHAPVTSKRPEITAPPAFPVQPPPADRPLIWFTVLSEQVPTALQLRATDWQGRKLGTVVIPCSGPCGVRPSPDGQRLLVGGQPGQGDPPNTQTVFDVRGRQIALIEGGGAEWADDSRHLCVLGSRTPAVVGEAELDVMEAATGARRRVATLSAAPDPRPGTVWTLLSCSVANDRAVLAFKDQAVRAVRVLQISTGATVYSRDDATSPAPCGCPVAGLISSADGTFAVENLAEGGVRRLDLGSAHPADTRAIVTGHGPVSGLSWSGRLALTPLGVFDTRTGATVWQSPSPAYVVMAGSQPQSDGMLLSVWVQGAAGSREVILHPDRPQVDLPPGFAPQPPPP